MSKSDVLKTKSPSRYLTWGEAMEMAQEAMPTQSWNWDTYARTLIELDKMDVGHARYREQRRKERRDEAHLDLITVRAIRPNERMYALLAKKRLTPGEEVELELMLADAEARADAMLGKEERA